MVLGEDERERDERHRFPREEEREGVTCDDHGQHRDDEEHVEGSASGKGALVSAVAERVDTGHHADRSDDDTKEDAQSVDLPCQDDAGYRTRQRHRFRMGAKSDAQPLVTQNCFSA